MMHGGGMGGMHGGMGGSRWQPMATADSNSLRDDTVMGKAYDHRVVTRMAPYIKPYKVAASVSLLAVMVYTCATVAIPYLVKWAIDDFITPAEDSGVGAVRSHLGGDHLPHRHRGAFRLQLRTVSWHGQGKPRHPLRAAHPHVQPPAGPLALVLPSHRGGAHHVPRAERCAAVTGDLQPDGHTPWPTC